MKRIIEKCAIGAAAACLTVLAGCTLVPLLRGGTDGNAGAYAAATIARDPWSVPFIDAPDEAAAAFALAYAMAEDGFAELEESYATALGRAAAYHGEAAVASDVLRVTLGSVERARAEFAQLPDSTAAIWRGFADGLNTFLQQRPAQRPHHFARFEPWIVYAYARDVVAVQPVEQALAGQSTRPGAPQAVADEDLFVAAVGADGTGHVAMFVAASTSARPYELDLRIGTAPRFHAFSELGVPVAREGFTDRIAFRAWPSPRDSVLERVVAARGGATFTSTTDSVRVNTAEGVVTRMIEVVHIGGRPAVELRGDTAWVARHADIDAAAVFAQWRAMSRARSTADAAAAAGTPLLQYMHASGATNLARAVSRPSIREPAAAEEMAGVTSWTLARLVAVAFDTRVATAEDAIAGIVDEWEQVGARNPERAAALDSAVAILRAWDRQSAAGSPAMSLYASWFDHHAALDGDGALTRFRALELAIGNRQTYPPRPWSQTNRVVRTGEGAGHATAGAPGRYGVLFAYDQRKSPRSVWAVDLITGAAESVVSYGQSWDSSSPHWMDQAPLFAAATLKPITAGSGAAGGHLYRPYASTAETRAQMLP